MKTARYDAKRDRLRALPILIVALAALSLPQVAAAADLPAPTGLLCELMARPELTVIQDATPEFSWVMNSPLRGDVQTAYQIHVKDLGKEESYDWDSGKVMVGASTNVAYGGPDLQSGSAYSWKVRLWNKDGVASPYSESQTLTMAKQLGEYATSRYPLQETKVAPVRTVKKGKGHYFVDFGKDAFGTVLLTATSPEDGHTVTIRLGEQAEDEAVNRRPKGTIRYAKIALTLKKGTHTYRIAPPKDKRNTSGAAILIPERIGVIVPFRYCELEKLPGKLKADDIRQITVHYPFDETASSFTCSDETLNAVWDICKYSMKATSFCGVYVDGDRERIPYEADAYLNQLSHYGADREFTLARYSHEYLITHPTWPTEWILHSVLMAYADYEYTGNTESLAHWYEDLRAKTLLALAREDGLISTQTDKLTEDVLKSIHIGSKIKDIVDWPPSDFTKGKKFGERDGYEMAPVNTVVNAFHYRTLVLMGRIARALKKADDALAYDQQAERVKAAINAKLFDTASGLYLDGEDVTHSALHANMAPLAFGVVPGERVPAVADFLKSRGMACSVYGVQYLLEALYEAGEDVHALELMTAKHDRSWWNMIAAGSTITLEAWDWKYKNNLDWNHAWGAAPGNIIPRFLMGVRPLEAGFAKVLIQPQPGTLTHAKATVPTIRGPIALSFKNKPGKSFRLDVAIPANMTAEVHVPAGSAEAVTEGGKALGKALGVKFLRMEDGVAVLAVGSGSYRFASKR